MPTKLFSVRRRALLSALGIGLLSPAASAFDGPNAPPSDPSATQVPITPNSTRDAAARKVTSPAMVEPLGTPSSQAQGIGAPVPMASPQSGTGMMAPGGGFGTPAYGPGYGSVGGPGSGMPMGGAAGAPGTGGTPGAASGGTNPFASTGGVDDLGFSSGGTSNSSSFLPNVIGDMGPGVRTSAVPTTPGNSGVPGAPKTPPSNEVTSILRVFKISENQSPRPQDRVFFTFNYFNDVNSSINKLNNSPISGIKIYRYVWGFEKTFDEGRGSVGLSLPLYSLFANAAPSSGVTAPGSTSLGDLNIFAKYILKENKETGSLLSTGLLLTPPTGPRYLAGANYFPQSKYPGSFVPVHDLQIQPFIGYIFQRDRFYIQGFSALNVAVNPQDVTLYFNDVQFGYFLFRDRETDRFLTAVVPTFEAHITNPLNHRGVSSPDPNKSQNFQYDPYGTPDTVNLTYGINFEIRRNSLLTLAFAEPVTSYKPFAYEAFVLFNYRFGRSRALINPPPNVVGG